MPVQNHCPEGLRRNDMNAISAPYNFVPLNRKVVIPEWGKQVSHDWPFEDGISGEIHYSLIAHSPLLVGGHQKPASDNAPGEVHPFKLPDGRYAIPGSSLKGMLRAIIEIAGFGRMRMVDEVRPGLRDISGGNVSKSYTEKVRNRVKTGFLRQRPDGGQEIVPCKMVRLNHRTLEIALGRKPADCKFEDYSDGEGFPLFTKKNKKVREKYDIWKRLCFNKKWDPEELSFNIQGYEATDIGKGKLSGYPVFSGQISDCGNNKKNKEGKLTKGKYKDFVFYDRNESGVIPVSQQTWRDFLLIHGDKETDKKSREEMSWPGYWRQKFRNGEEVPVFYVKDGHLLRIGLAYMPKLAGDFTTHDLIRHASEKHLDAPGQEHGYDLADLLFGAVGKNQNDALRGRVSCETAIAEGQPKEQEQPATILNGPKPTYFPNYIEQPSRDGLHLEGDQYMTYMDTGGDKPIVRGFKRYPARPDDKTGVQRLLPGQKTTVQVRLFPLESGTRFKGRIVFHNLKPEELGALLWAMTWGGDDALRHGLGMGKSFGFGQVGLEIDESHTRLIPNHPELEKSSITELIDRFVGWMSEQLEDDEEWENTPQIRNLLAMADPASAEELPYGMDLRHMCLNMEDNKFNEFVQAKQVDPALVLVDYSGAVDWPTKAAIERWRQRASESTHHELEQSNIHPWIKTELEAFMRKTNASGIEDLMRHGNLYKAWNALEDIDTKRAVFEEVRAYWQEQGWWDEPPGKSARKLKNNYERQAKKLD